MPANVQRGFLISGKVQKAGFRPFLKELAYEHGLSGFAENLNNRMGEEVLIVCKGSDERIRGFQKDLEAEEGKQKESRQKTRVTEAELTQTTEELDEKITAKTQGNMTQQEKDEVIRLLTKRKTLLRQHALLERTSKPYLIEFIKPLTPKGLLDYKANIKKAAYKNSFKIVRKKGESDDRLDEGLGFLAGIRSVVSPYQYEAIDTDFAIMDMKYNKLTDTIANDFPKNFARAFAKDFSKNFAQVFEEILSSKYGMKPQGVNTKK